MVPASKRLEQVQMGLQAIELLRGMDLPGMAQSWDVLAQKLQVQEAGWAEESGGQGKASGAGKGGGSRRPPTDILLQRSRQKAAKLDRKLQYLQEDEQKLLELKAEVDKHLGHIQEQQKEVEAALDEEEEYRKKLAASLAKSAGVRVVQESDEESAGDDGCSLSGDSGSEGGKGSGRKRRRGPFNVPRELQVPSLAKKLLQGVRAGASAEAAAVHVALRAWLEKAGQKGDLGDDGEAGGSRGRGGTKTPEAGEATGTVPDDPLAGGRGPLASTRLTLEQLVEDTKTQIECGDEEAKTRLEAVQHVLPTSESVPPAVSVSSEGKGGRGGRSQPY